MLESEYRSRLRTNVVRKGSEGFGGNMEDMVKEERLYKESLEKLKVKEKDMEEWTEKVKEYLQHNMLHNFLVDNLDNISHLHHLLSCYYGRQLEEYSILVT